MSDSIKVINFYEDSTKLLEIPSDSNRLTIQLLEKDSRTATDRARAEIAAARAEKILEGIEGINESISFLQSFFTESPSGQGQKIVNYTDYEYVTGSFSGSGEFTSFEIFDTIKYQAQDNFLLTSQSNNTSLIIGNEYRNYVLTQTTTFKNANVIISGSIEIAEQGILKLKPKDEEPTAVEGGLYYSSDGNFFAGFN